MTSATIANAPTPSSQHRSRLLIVTSTFPEQANSVQPDFVLELAKRLTTSFELTVVAPDQPGTRQNQVVESVQVHRFRYWFKPFQTLSGEGGIPARLSQRPWRILLVPLFMVAQIVAIRRLLKNDTVDLIHAHWMIPQGFCALLARGLAGRRIPIVTTVHGADLYALRWPGLGALKAWVLRRSEAVAAVSAAMKLDIEKLASPASIAVDILPMGVDLKHRFTPLPSATRKQRQLLFVGRLVPKKGVHHLIAAMPTVIEAARDVRLLVAGSGPEQTRLEALTLHLGMDDHIEFVGPASSDTVRDLMQASTIVVVPSVTAPDGDREGLGLVTIEAMGCGCAVVAHDFAAVHDVIVDGENGLLVPQGDETALGLALGRLLADPVLRRRLGAAARQSALQRFDWESAAERYAKLFRRILDRRQGGR